MIRYVSYSQSIDTTYISLYDIKQYWQCGLFHYSITCNTDNVDYSITCNTDNVDYSTIPSTAILTMWTIPLFHHLQYWQCGLFHCFITCNTDNVDYPTVPSPASPGKLITYAGWNHSIFHLGLSNRSKQQIIQTLPAKIWAQTTSLNKFGR